MNPCSGCPFSRAIKPGKLGGSGVSVYVGQAAGPFMLHCHQGRGYSPEESRRNLNLQQCRGAAIYRTNTGVSPFLPPQLLRADEDIEAVFASPAEFLCHHTGAPRSVVDAFLRENPVAALAQMQRERADNTLHPV